MNNRTGSNITSSTSVNTVGVEHRNHLDKVSAPQLGRPDILWVEKEVEYSLHRMRGWHFSGMDSGRNEEHLLAGEHRRGSLISGLESLTLRTLATMGAYRDDVYSPSLRGKCEKLSEEVWRRPRTRLVGLEVLLEGFVGVWVGESEVDLSLVGGGNVLEGNALVFLRANESNTSLQSHPTMTCYTRLIYRPHVLLIQRVLMNSRVADSEFEMIYSNWKACKEKVEVRLDLGLEGGAHVIGSRPDIILEARRLEDIGEVTRVEIGTSYDTLGEVEHIVPSAWSCHACCLSPLTV